VSLDQVARLPTPSDNAAIAVKTLSGGTFIQHEGVTFGLRHDILEGHRFPINVIRKGEQLLSWGMPFGLALRDLQPGEWLCNAGCLKSLTGRELPFTLPTEPNFVDHGNNYILDESAFVAGAPLPPLPPPTVDVYNRGDTRGCGTRNYVVVIGVTSISGSMARRISTRLKPKLQALPSVSGVVPVAHTEGGEGVSTHNLEHVMRVLSGFIVHPNVAAALIVDNGEGVFTAGDVETWMRDKGYPLAEVLHAFVKLTGNTEADFQTAEEIVDGWIPEISKMERSAQPASCLKIALQCGGSDAFSGISANPLVGLVSQRVVQWGGAANLAETDELIGAESYVLQNVRNLDVARHFLECVHRFSTLAGYHGHSAEGNPSAGNIFRGLYNIYLKSLGAAIKRPPSVRLEEVIDYGQRMSSGFHFMDSPGNDLESVAGQVASGCNVVFFTTGNGAVTNFPFVPTIKFLTTTARFNIMPGDMDVNAGRYLDGMPMMDLAEEVIRLTTAVASGQRTAGERAGHAQVQIWREWQQNAPALPDRPLPCLTIGPPITAPTEGWKSYDLDMPPLLMLPVSVGSRSSAKGTTHASKRVALMLPTSLCSSEIAGATAATVKQLEGVSLDVVSLPHTEGCGSSDGHNVQMYIRTMLGHTMSPLAGPTAFIEHGCEKTHNSYMQNEMRARNIDPASFGWFSLQLGGGIQKATADAVAWLQSHIASSSHLEREECGCTVICIAMASVGDVSAEVAKQLGMVASAWLSCGGHVVMPQGCSLLTSSEFTAALGLDTAAVQTPSIEYGAGLPDGGACGEEGVLHVMQMFSSHWVETLSGLGGCGAQAIVVAGLRPLQAHPFIPTVLVPGSDAVPQWLQRAEFDCNILDGVMADNVLQALARALSGQPQCQASFGNTDFQICRGPLGFSM